MACFTTLKLFNRSNRPRIVDHDDRVGAVQAHDHGLSIGGYLTTGPVA